MDKSFLKQMLTYINKVYDIGEKINSRNPMEDNAFIFFPVYQRL